MAFFYLYTTWYATPGPGTFFLNKILYGSTLAALVIWMVSWRWRLHRKLPMHLDGAK
jgi:hypothetical protein